MSNMISYLFETKAFKICPENKPFWYTSGKIGPYFINTHFLYGSEKEASEFLEFINEEKEHKLTLPERVFKQSFKQYNENTIYHTVIDQMKSFIEENIPVEEVDYISGGERRDWFFSNILAHLLNKPHLTIFKDLQVVASDSNFEETTLIEKLNGAKVLHIADLITVASSYIRAWIPAIEEIGGTILWSAVVVDRMQGGGEKLKAKNVDSYSLVHINKDLFDQAFKMGIINSTQQDMLYQFFDNPDESMRNFLLAHPEFLEQALASDEKTAKRAQTCIDNNLYNLV